MFKEEYAEYYIPCIGVDNKIHYCLPWDDITICGIKVIKKNVTDIDFGIKYTCYDCDD